MNGKEMKYGYIYIRRHIHFDSFHVCKVGKTINIAERDSTYATNEFIRGHFCNIYRFNYEQLSMIDNKIKSDFKFLNKKSNGGTEFFDLSIIDKIQNYFASLNIDFYSLTNQEIELEIKNFKLKQVLEKLCVEKMKRLFSSKKKSQHHFTPRFEQSIIIKKTVGSLLKKGKGILCLPCGVGKTLISLFVSQQMNCKSTCIGVPNILLLEQWEKVVRKFYPNKQVLCVKDSITCARIKEFLQQSGECCILITTYNSSKKVADTTKSINFMFDFKICDEAHHITTQDFQGAQNRNTFINIMNIPARYQISLTATPKYIVGSCNEENVISNSTIEQFGEIIEKKNLLWAIHQKIVCDYKIHVLKTDEEKLDSLFKNMYRKPSEFLDETEKRLFLSAVSAVNSMNDCKKVLVYTNCKENSDRIIKFVGDLLMKKGKDIFIFYSVYNSELNAREQKKILEKFETNSCAIISCVYCLGEGYDFPALDGVIFAENMSSNIRIVQSALRPCRKDKERPDKIARLYLPIVNKEDFLESNDNSDLLKIRTLIHEMGLEDGDICEKISYQEVVVNYEISESDLEDESLKKGLRLRTSMIDIDLKICEKIKFKIFNRESLGAMTYENAKNFLANKHCKTKQEYIAKFKNNSRLSMEPEVFYGSVFNWKDYLSIPEDTYYNKSECMEKVQQHLYNQEARLNTDYFSLCKLLHEKDSKFPPAEMWIHFYQVNKLDEIIILKSFTKKTSKIKL